MATVNAHNTISTPQMAEDVVLSISHHVGDFHITFGGENASGPRADGWLSIGRYSPQDGMPGEGEIVPLEVDAGVAEFGVLTTGQLRDLAVALTRAADRYDVLREGIRTDITPTENPRRRA